jgi:hypothetical protein
MNPEYHVAAAPPPADSRYVRDPGAPQHSTTATLRNVAENVAKLGGLLAAAGYLSLRTHLNRYGLSVTVSLGAERYLTEIWPIVSWFVARYALLSAVLTIFALAIEPWWRRTRGPAVLTNVHARWVLVAWLAVATVVLGLFLGHWPRDPDLAVGLLPADALYAIASEDRSWLVDLLCASVVAGLFALGHVRRRADVDTVAVAARRIGQILWVAIVLMIPVAYGSSVRDRRYPVALVSSADGRSITCGLLVAATSDSATLWRAESRVGSTVQISRDRGDSVRIGRLEDLALDAAVAANTGSMIPDCTHLRAEVMPR